MANFAAILDPDPQRRSDFLDRSHRALAPFPGLVRARKDVGDFSIAWAASPNAPISWEEDDRWACLLLGEAIPADSDRRIEARDVAQAWIQAEGVFPGWDGFHAAVLFDKIQGRILAGADCLGTFPIYLLDERGTAVLASSPEIIACHPKADLSIDLQGFAGILHTCGLVGERTICKGIKRLAPRKILLLDSRAASRADQEGIPWDPDLAAEWSRLDEDAHAAILAQASLDAARRHLPSTRRTGLLFSGGLDSRMMAGLARECGLNPDTVTFGSGHDMESLIARLVAKHLGWSNRTLKEPYGDLAQLGRQLAAREHLSAGFAFSFGPLLSDPGLLASSGDRILTGLQLDFVASGVYVAAARPDQYNLGFLPSTMRKLLPPGDFLDAYEAMIREGNAVLATYPGEDYQRVLLRDLDQRARFHVGINFQRLSFGSWPVSLSMDRRYISVCRALPDATTRNRRAQRRLVREMFPDLASFPLDQNAENWDHLEGVGRRRLVELRLRLRRKLNVLRGRELRYYHTVYELETDHWNRIRELAEPGREGIRSLFRSDAFDQLLPSPGTAIPLDGEDGITGSAARKVLLGAMILARELPLAAA